MDSLQSILAIRATNKWYIEQMDIVSVYLAGTLDKEIYIEAPEGLGHPKGTVVKLVKALYSLKQSGRIWYKRIESTLNSCGLEHTDSDWSVFTDKEQTLIVRIYVDDLVITGADLAKIKVLKATISKAYPVKDLGEIGVCLGLHIVQNKATSTLEIDQTHYIDNMLQAYRMRDCTPVSSLIEGYKSTAPKTPGEPLADAQLYQQAIGSLQYCAVGTRMDISYALG
jgi:hypothetical protein